MISAGGLKEENSEIRSLILNNKERKYIFGLLAKCEVNNAHKYVRKELGQYPAILTEQAWSIDDLLHGFRKSVSCGTHRVVPSGQDSAILPAWVANYSAGFGSSRPLTELAM